MCVSRECLCACCVSCLPRGVCVCVTHAYPRPPYVCICLREWAVPWLERVCSHRTLKFLGAPQISSRQWRTFLSPVAISKIIYQMTSSDYTWVLCLAIQGQVHMEASYRNTQLTERSTNSSIHSFSKHSLSTCHAPNPVQDMFSVSPFALWSSSWGRKGILAAAAWNAA